MSVEQQYIDLFSRHEALICRHCAEALNAPRAEAFAAFERLGFPTNRQEKYKYTDVSKFFEPDYGMNLNRLQVPVNPYDVFKCDVPNMSTALYFVVNDTFYTGTRNKGQATRNKHLSSADDADNADSSSSAKETMGEGTAQPLKSASSASAADEKFSSSQLLPDNVLLCSLNEAARRYPDLVKKYYGKLADVNEDGLTAFNTTFAQDGLFLYVPRGVVVEKPLQLINVLRSDVPLMVNRRVLIVLEEGAQARLLVCDHAMDSVNFLATQVVEIFAGPRAVLDLYELEETHNATVRFSNLYLRQEADSNVLLNGMTLTGGTTRNQTCVTLAGEGAELSLNGMAIADGNQHVDNHTRIDHAVPRCTSNELYKYVLDEQATGAFAGLVLVRPGAQHTNSQQTNRNLCATREARMYTQPQLEIYADDVKCSHGATVGQLDDAALFYMRQRGIPLREARLLLMFAFVGEVIDSIRLDALRDRLHHLVEKRFRGELNKCKGCRMCK